jgi:tetratricopeptide (TPR) repeat protein
MAFLKSCIAVMVLLISMGVLAQESKLSSEENQKIRLWMNGGSEDIAAGRLMKALGQFDTVIAFYEEKYRDEKAKIYCARSQPEALLYMLEAATKKISATVLSYDWANAHFMKAYTLVELRKLPEAQEQLERAIALSPRNARFLGELAGIYQAKKDWPMAMQTFKAAEAAAREISPPDFKNAELSRAWRGLGYVHIELNQLDEAEKMYRQCLELNPKDGKATLELNYIQKLRAKAGEKQ